MTTRWLKLLPWSVPLLAAVFAWRRQGNTDTWWHLASGRWIVEHGRLPSGDPFSYTVPGAEWINLQWLFDVAIYIVHRVAGIEALVLLSVVAYAATVAAAVFIARKRLEPLATTVLVTWVVFVAQPRFEIRPEMARSPAC